MKTILLTNDDGFEGSGLLELQKRLKECLKDKVKIIVIAPSKEKSACGHGLSITSALKLIEVSKDFYKLDDGAPTDCIYIGLNEFFKNTKPSLIISGINIGSNLGEDVTYSGTIAGAMEGSIYGVASIAISQVIKDKHLNKTHSFDFSNALDFIEKFILEDKNISLLNNLASKRKFLNINIPASPKINGIKITQLGSRVYSNEIKKGENPRYEKYFWIGLQALKWQKREIPSFAQGFVDSNLCTDFEAIDGGYISITPISTNFTSYEDISGCKDLII